MFDVEVYLSPFDQYREKQEFDSEEELYRYMDTTFICDICNRRICTDNGRLFFYRWIDDSLVCLDCLQKQILKEGISPRRIGEIVKNEDRTTIRIGDKVYAPRNKLPEELMYYNHDELKNNGYQKYTSCFIKYCGGIIETNAIALKLLSQSYKVIYDMGPMAITGSEGYVNLWIK